MNGSNLRNVPSRLFWSDLNVNPWWSRNPKKLYPTSVEPALIEALGAFITDDNTASIEDGDSGIAAEALLELLCTVLTGRCIFTCAPDPRRCGVPQIEVIGVGSSFLEIGDEIISICNQRGYRSKCSWDCVSERLFLVRDTKPNPKSDSAPSPEEKPSAQQFVGDCLLPSTTWIDKGHKLTQVPFFQLQSTMRTLILS